jgi:hypothetical protein
VQSACQLRVAYRRRPWEVKHCARFAAVGTNHQGSKARRKHKGRARRNCSDGWRQVHFIAYETWYSVLSTAPFLKFLFVPRYESCPALNAATNETTFSSCSSWGVLRALVVSLPTAQATTQFYPENPPRVSPIGPQIRPLQPIRAAACCPNRPRRRTDRECSSRQRGIAFARRATPSPSAAPR